MQVATSLRKLRPNSSIAFFLHIPFPAPDIFEKLPWRKELLQGLLDHDFVGLQTDRDLHNLVACLRSRLPRVTITGRGNKRKVTGLRGTTILQAMPISIDYTEFAHMAASAEIKKRASQLREDLGGLQLILGVDRLDYTKGIPERLRAYHALLRDQPQLCGKISMIQIAIPSREGIEEYQELRAEIERLVSSINGDLSQPGWIPVQYMYRSVPREELIALYRCADIALITPLKDGMNLVAKEYCAAQVDQNGILVLSEFAGAAPELRNAAILVNPYDEVGTAGALRQAIEMPAQERRQRMARLRRQVREADILHWRDSFFTSFEKLESRR
jgi:trehalose 6-phosphate synthase